MLLNLHEMITKHNMNITGVIHVGAHFGEEYDDYKKAGIQNIIFIEPCQDAFDELFKKFHNSVDLYRLACGNIPKGEHHIVTINVERRNGGQSNSILTPAKHLEHYPDITFNETEEVILTSLDTINIDHSKYNMLMMDVQGYELEVLKGGTETLDHIKYVYSEVNTDELYHGCAKLTDLQNFLSDFEMVDIKMTNQNWGDALFIRK